MIGQFCGKCDSETKGEVFCNRCLDDLCKGCTIETKMYGTVCKGCLLAYLEGDDSEEHINQGLDLDPGN